MTFGSPSLASKNLPLEFGSPISPVSFIIDLLINTLLLGYSLFDLSILLDPNAVPSRVQLLFVRRQNFILIQISCGCELENAAPRMTLLFFRRQVYYTLFIPSLVCKVSLPLTSFSFFFPPNLLLLERRMWVLCVNNVWGTLPNNLPYPVAFRVSLWFGIRAWTISKRRKKSGCPSALPICTAAYVSNGVHFSFFFPCIFTSKKLLIILGRI